MSKLKMTFKCSYYVFQIFEEKSENRKDIKKGRKPMQDLSHHAFLIATGIFKFLRRIF